MFRPGHDALTAAEGMWHKPMHSMLRFMLDRMKGKSVTILRIE